MVNPKDVILHLPQELMDQIKQINQFQIDELLQAVIRQCDKLHPDQEAIFLTLPRDPVSRSAELETLISYIRSISNLSAHSE